MAESAPPPPSGGNTKYVIIGILLLLAAAGIWMMIRPTEQVQTPPAAQDAGAPRPRKLAQSDFVIPEPEPDAGPQIDAGRRVKIVYRYVGGNWDCSGDVAGARDVMNEHRTQFRNCYERALKVQNTLQGNVSLNIKVGRNGAVEAAQASGSLRNNEVFSCMRRVAEGMHFPPPTGGNCAVVSQPFNFTPQN